MNKYALILILFLLGVCQTNHAAQAPPAEFIGVVSHLALLEQYPEFKTEFDNFQPTASDLVAVQSLEGKKLVVLFGTWCHDSVREVPRLLKLLDSSAVKLQDVQLIAVNHNKQDPSNLHTQYSLKYTPTIILIDGERELGRIIETPVVSLSQDLAGFVLDSGA